MPQFIAPSAIFENRYTTCQPLVIHANFSFYTLFTQIYILLLIVCVCVFVYIVCKDSILPQPQPIDSFAKLSVLSACKYVTTAHRNTHFTNTISQLYCHLQINKIKIQKNVQFNSFTHEPPHSVHRFYLLPLKVMAASSCAQTDRLVPSTMENIGYVLISIWNYCLASIILLAIVWFYLYSLRNMSHSPGNNKVKVRIGGLLMANKLMVLAKRICWMR